MSQITPLVSGGVAETFEVAGPPRVVLRPVRPRQDTGGEPVQPASGDERHRLD